MEVPRIQQNKKLPNLKIHLLRFGRIAIQIYSDYLRLHIMGQIAVEQRNDRFKLTQHPTLSRTPFVNIAVSVCRTEKQLTE